MAQFPSGKCAYLKLSTRKWIYLWDFWDLFYCFFYWSIIALQCCVVSFCSTTKWISCVYSVALVVSDSLWPSDCSRQVLLSMGFPRQEYWNGLPFLSLGDLPDPGIEPRSPKLQADSLPSKAPGKLNLDEHTIKSQGYDSVALVWTIFNILLRSTTAAALPTPVPSHGVDGTMEEPD